MNSLFSRKKFTVNFLLLVLKCLKFNCFVLQSQKIKCFVLSRCPDIQTVKRVLTSGLYSVKSGISRSCGSIAVLC